MEKKKSKKKKTIIDTSSNSIVCPDTSIKLSDAHLNNMLIHLYETAREDADKFHWYKYYSNFISIGAALLLALLTSDFKPCLGYTAIAVKNIVTILCILSFLSGFLLAICNVMKKHERENVERDKAIEDTMRQINNESVDID